MITTRFRRFERTSKRRKGFPSETRVKRGARTVKGGQIELLEKLGRGDPCPCGSGKRFQEMLPAFRPLSMVQNGGITGGEIGAMRITKLSSVDFSECLSLKIG